MCEWQVMKEILIEFNNKKKTNLKIKIESGAGRIQE
jgi:hypothetical protein